VSLPAHHSLVSIDYAASIHYLLQDNCLWTQHPEKYSLVQMDCLASVHHSFQLDSFQQNIPIPRQCKVSVYMKICGEITLNEHHSNCKIAERLRDVKSLDNVQSNQNGSNERKRKSTFCPEVNGLLENSNLDSTKLGDQTISPTHIAL
jgi:hypothetical protein